MTTRENMLQADIDNLGVRLHALELNVHAMNIRLGLLIPDLVGDVVEGDE